MLTATPIPRTVAMTVFGDLDVSTIRTMPEGRAGIQTFVAPARREAGVVRRASGSASPRRSRKGHQAFVVCAAIDAEAVAQGRHRRRAGRRRRGRGAPHALGRRAGRRPAVAASARSPTSASQILHGKMPSDEKDAVMQAFARGDIDVLVATTVVEVGVDVPNASTMAILEADRFGVSQLHQLRGRVGRGGVPGLCLLVTEAPAGTPARAAGRGGRRRRSTDSSSPRSTSSCAARATCSATRSRARGRRCGCCGS